MKELKGCCSGSVLKEATKPKAVLVSCDDGFAEAPSSGGLYEAGPRKPCDTLGGR